jgi:ABC-type spermidine/putrescine transport system permease subunit I
MASPPAVLVLIFVGVPIVIGVLYTLGYTGGLNSVASTLAVQTYPAVGAGPTLAAYSVVFADATFRANLIVTVWVTVVTVLVVTVIAWAVALYTRLAGGWLGRFISGVAIIPLFIPIVIGAYAIRQFYGSTGFPVSLGRLMGIDVPVWTLHTQGIVVGQIWASLPFAVLLISSGLAAVPDSLIDAARDTGASLARAVWSVMLPMATVPTVIVATFTGVGVMGSFTVPYLIGPASPNMLGVALQQTYASFARPQNAQVMAVVMFAMAGLIGAAYVWANARQAKQSAVI